MKNVEKQEEVFYRKEYILSSIATILFVGISILSVFREEILGIKKGYAPPNFSLNILSIAIYFMVFVIAFIVLWEIKINWTVLTKKRKLRLPIFLCVSLLFIEISFVLMFIIF